MSPRCSSTYRSRRRFRTAASSSPCTSPSPELVPHRRSAIIATQQSGPGAVRVADGTLVLNADRTAAERRTLVVVNTGDRPVQIGSHIHLAEVNRALSFNRELAVGFRLDIPSGTSRRFEPGASREVEIVALRGRRLVPGIQITKPKTPSDG